VFFAGAILVPCLLAARPSLRGAAPSSPHAPATGASATAAAPCERAARLDARLVIHVEACRFELLDACGRVQRSGPCSTGSDSTLYAPDGRRWTFRTPRGARRVHHKAQRPVWYKPDWAYIEEGLTVPPADAESRYVRGMLGRYALDIGNGYLVHGSPYRIGIGTRSTHGCVRLLDADLEIVFRTLQVGDEVVLR
jgi:L,D-transpeptidase YbiS